MLALLAIAARTITRASEPKLYGGSGGDVEVSGGIHVGSSIAWGVTVVSSTERTPSLRLLRAEPVGDSKAFRFLGARAARPDRRDQVGLGDWPPEASLEAQPVAGTVVPFGHTEANRSVELVLGFEAVMPGSLRVKGIDFTYRTDGHVRRQRITSSTLHLRSLPASPPHSGRGRRRERRRAFNHT